MIPPSRWRRFHALFVSWAIALSVIVGASPAYSQESCAEHNPFDLEFAGSLSDRYPGKRFSASVYDARTGCQYDLGRHERITTASVVKIEVMAGVLLRAQDQGRGLSSWERSRIEPMITESANNPTSELFVNLGGTGGFASIDERFGLTETQLPPTVWGLTETSARDQVNLIRQVLLGEYGPLAPEYREEAWRYMTSVVPNQTWGITAGVEPRWTVAQKNGFAGSSQGWRINSVGFVQDLEGSGYAVSILSVGWSSQAQGVPAVEYISQQIASTLAPLSTTPENPFVDVGSTDWFYEPVQWAVENGVTSGTSATTFDPFREVTRGELAAFLVRALDLRPSTATPHFTDTTGSIFYDDIESLLAAHITQGCNPPIGDEYCPLLASTRGEFAALLARALDLPSSTTDQFSDDDTSIFESDLERLAEAGILLGCNPPLNDRACPDSLLTRAEVVALLERID